MENELTDSLTFSMTIDKRCRSCVMPRLLVRDLAAWDEYPDDGDVAQAIAEHVESRCGSCAEGCHVVEDRDGHFRVEIASA